MKKILVIILILGVAVGGRLLYLSQQGKEAETPVPVITAMDILHASDLKAGVKQAVRKGDEDAVEQWMDRALHVGEEASLSEADLAWLASEQAQDYVVFNAKRSLFNDAFEQRYLALEGIDDLKAKYPEARDLFGKADNLINKRDQIIYSIAQTLSSGNEPSADALAEAREQWKARYATGTDVPQPSVAQPGVAQPNVAQPDV